MKIQSTDYVQKVIFFFVNVKCFWQFSHKNELSFYLEINH